MKYYGAFGKGTNAHVVKQSVQASMVEDAAGERGWNGMERSCTSWEAVWELFL